jgi:hypothetical protein
MKQHFLGLIIFSFIFASFAFAFAFFYAPPIPQIGEVEENFELTQPIKRYEKTSCFPKRTKEITSEVVSSQLFLDEEKIISEIKLSWNGSGEPPKKVSVMTNFFTLKNDGKFSFGTLQVFDEPFNGETEKTFSVVSRITDKQKIGKHNNFYVISSASDFYSADTKGEPDKGIADATQVLFVHGDDSIIKK